MDNTIAHLTKIDDINYLLYQGDKMKGSIRVKGICPVCREKFQQIPKLGYICSTCKTLPSRLYVDVNFKGQRIRIFSDSTGQAIDSWQRASNLLARINFELTNHTFDPTKYVKADLVKFTLATRLNNWITDKQREVGTGNIAPSTVKTYKTYARCYYIPLIGTMDIRELRTYDIQEFYKRLPQKSMKYIKSILDTLKNFLNEMRRLEFIATVPSFPTIKLSSQPIKWVNRDTQDAIISEIPIQHRPIYYFMTRQVCRPSEARTLKVKDLSLQNDTITIQRTFSVNQIVERDKEGNGTERALNPELNDILAATIKGKFAEEFVFTVKGRPYGKAINRIWNNACKKVGVKISLYNGTKHSICSQAGRAGIGDSGIQQLANHADIRSTKKYINKDNLEAQINMYQKIASVTNLSPTHKKTSNNS